MTETRVYCETAEAVLARLMPPGDWVATPAERYAWHLNRFRRAFEGTPGPAGSYEWRPAHDEGNPGDRAYYSTGPELAHSEWRTGLAFWDNPRIMPPPSLVVAQTPCLAEDLARPDDVRDYRDAGRWYKCRLRHVHHGHPPYGTDIPEEVQVRISRWLGEEQG